MADDLDFLLDDEEPEDGVVEAGWPILIVDDEPAIHQVTRLALAGLRFRGRPLNLISAHSAAEALAIMRSGREIAVILMDVVMETDTAGLLAVKVIREELGNRRVRIILRTGQPGQAPERTVIDEYDINDYKAKTELTREKLYISIVGTLRSYDDIMVIEQARRVIEGNRLGLIKVIDASSTIFRLQSIDRFAQGVLEQLHALLCIDREALFVRASGIAALAAGLDSPVVAGTGRYATTRGQPLVKVVDPRLLPAIRRAAAEGLSQAGTDFFIGCFLSAGGEINLLIIDGPIDLSVADHNLVELFCRNVGIAYENLVLRREIEETQREIVYRMGEMIETRSRETGNHVRRVAEYSYIIARQLGMEESEAELLRTASPLHDVGKVAIPDRILQKPGPLTAEERTQIEGHVAIGHSILRDVRPRVWQVAAVIAHEHHERWDGKGYPRGLAGEAIDLKGRITALADVFDALSSRRAYKDPWPLDKVLEQIRRERGGHFDPRVVDAFFDAFDAIDAVRRRYQDPSPESVTPPSVAGAG